MNATGYARCPDGDHAVVVGAFAQTEEIDDPRWTGTCCGWNWTFTTDQVHETAEAAMADPPNMAPAYEPIDDKTRARIRRIPVEQLGMGDLVITLAPGLGDRFGVAWTVAEVIRRSALVRVVAKHITGDPDDGEGLEYETAQTVERGRLVPMIRADDLNDD